MPIKPVSLMTPNRKIPRRRAAGVVHDPRLEIVGYLCRHPAAADSLDGIVDWWLPQQRYETARAAIQEALDDLLQRGVVDEFVRGETRLYRLSRAVPRDAESKQ